MFALKLRYQDFLFFLFILLPLFPSSASASKEIETAERSDIVVINAMAQELKRSQSELKLEGYEAPYFISYQIKDNSYYSIEGKYGAVVSSDHNRIRRLFVDVRVGITSSTIPSKAARAAWSRSTTPRRYRSITTPTP